MASHLCNGAISGYLNYMHDAKTASPARRNTLMERFCETCLPNCGKAMTLVETGRQRNLSIKERALLKYHGRLCPFCACATGKFEAGMRLMREAEDERGSRTVP